MYRADPASSPGRDRGKGRKDKNGKEKGKGGKGGKVWWNYFHLGLDFLVDEDEGGVVVKVMVHSNIVSRRLASIGLHIANTGRYHSQSRSCPLVRWGDRSAWYRLVSAIRTVSVGDRRPRQPHSDRVLSG